jgi:hypothetical protein
MPEPLTPTTTDALPPAAPAITEASLKQRSQELGLLGKIFGSREHAPINVAGAIMMIGLCGMIAVPLFPASPSLSHADLEKGLGGLVLAALTFLGGYLGGGKKE